MTAENLLFVRDNLSAVLEAQFRAAILDVEQWEPGQLLATADADVLEYLVSQYSVDCPVTAVVDRDLGRVSAGRGCQWAGGGMLARHAGNGCLNRREGRRGCRDDASLWKRQITRQPLVPA
jgi:hypothetical protein